MKTKKYIVQGEHRQENASRVKEEAAQYGPSAPRKAEHVGLSVAAAKSRLRKPVKRSAKEIRWAMAITGIGKGPKDLAENMRAYLRREK